MSPDLQNIIGSYNFVSNQDLIKEFRDKVFICKGDIGLVSKSNFLFAQWRIPTCYELYTGIYNFKKELHANRRIGSYTEIALIFQVVGSLPGNYKIGNYK